MKMQPIYTDLPEMYRSILPAFFEEQIPVEEHATCDNCAMCQKAGESTIPGVEYFKPDVKCCSYFPKLPNYLVGGLLADTNPALEEGRRRVRERIRSRVAITPQAVSIPKRYALLHKYGAPRSFGRSGSLICPYYVKEGGLCSIWKFRDSVCSTYFCKSMAGKEGLKFWTGLRTYLNQAQETLSWYPLYKMNWYVEVIFDHLHNWEAGTLEPEDLDDTPPPEENYKKLWMNWIGREEEFYLECYKLTSQLTREEYDRISGMNERVILHWLKDKHNDVINPNIPPVLRKNPDLKAYQMPNGTSYTVKTDVGFFTIEKALFDVLDWFDGVKTTEDIKKMVYEKYKDELNDDLLLPMYFNRMLIPA